ncbi:DUF551 domain-containing protein [Hymenobacter sp. 15J16-1T3B]|uniref:DUF551 domain-containing protein n=1 Tax=Hymenobacter sp. 15J16-1T3B TaxID=2886941 RepID=UPI001D10062E|nr:DUF551 domain-containing protein [Hymenobacter sp. 15J16-1T3B]MCC3159716.1 DUF551 domain-containing protein [Hymenobacter sp. 15J16-1T3B]
MSTIHHEYTINEPFSTDERRRLIAEADELADTQFEKSEWVDRKQEGDTKFGFRCGYLTAMRKVGAASAVSTVGGGSQTPDELGKDLVDQVLAEEAVREFVAISSPSEKQRVAVLAHLPALVRYMDLLDEIIVDLKKDLAAASPEPADIRQMLGLPASAPSGDVYQALTRVLEQASGGGGAAGLANDVSNILDWWGNDGEETDYITERDQKRVKDELRALRSKLLSSAAPATPPQVVSGGEGWIAVAERLPETEGDYIVWGNCTGSGYRVDMALFLPDAPKGLQFMKAWQPTHWQPLPAAPSTTPANQQDGKEEVAC